MESTRPDDVTRNIIHEDRNHVNNSRGNALGITNITHSKVREISDGQGLGKFQYNSFTGKYRTRSCSLDSASSYVQPLVSTTECQRRPCSKIIVWLFGCFVLSLLSLVVMFVVWTLVSYRNAITSLEERVVRLEGSHEDYQLRIDRLVSERLDVVVKQRIQGLRSITKRASECGCSPGDMFVVTARQKALNELVRGKSPADFLENREEIIQNVPTEGKWFEDMTIPYLLISPAAFLPKKEPFLANSNFWLS